MSLTTTLGIWNGQNLVTNPGCGFPQNPPPGGIDSQRERSTLIRGGEVAPVKMGCQSEPGADFRRVIEKVRRCLFLAASLANMPKGGSRE